MTRGWLNWKYLNLLSMTHWSHKGFTSSFPAPGKAAWMNGFQPWVHTEITRKAENVLRTGPSKSRKCIVKSLTPTLLFLVVF